MEILLCDNRKSFEVLEIPKLLNSLEARLGTSESWAWASTKIDSEFIEKYWLRDEQCYIDQVNNSNSTLYLDALCESESYDLTSIHRSILSISSDLKHSHYLTFITEPKLLEKFKLIASELSHQQVILTPSFIEFPPNRIFKNVNMLVDYLKEKNIEFEIIDC